MLNPSGQAGQKTKSGPGCGCSAGGLAEITKELGVFAGRKNFSTSFKTIPACQLGKCIQFLLQFFNVF